MSLDPAVGVLFSMTAYCSEKDVTVIKSDKAIICFQTEGAGKLPVVFLAHNGGAKKEDWGDFPRKLASEGFFAVSIGWTESGGRNDLKENIESVLKAHGDKMDAERVAFIGGCHGGVIMVPLMKDPSLTYKVKTAVFLSVSEMISLPKSHVPILGIYSTDDHLGDYYKGFTKKLVEEVITEPKKAFALKGTPHGNELVTDEASRESVGNEISLWLKDHLADR